MDKWIKLSLPHKSGSEMKWVEEAYRDDWFVPLGPNVDRFEHLLEEYQGQNRKVVALSAGTAAIHLGLVMLGVKKGDEVICQSMTFSASANPILYQGATPVFVDSEPATWNIDPDLLETAIADRIRLTGKKPRAIVVVDLYGMPARLHEIVKVAERYQIPVLEDAAEAMGSELLGVKCGNWGDYGTLSFNGNKIITTSGGGALICPAEDAAKRVKFLSTQARENRPYYYHKEVGYNYRLSNISAGIGCGQMETIDERVARRREIHQLYADAFANHRFVTVHTDPSPEYKSNYWLTTILINQDSPLSADQLRVALAEKKIETRLLWRPMHMQPVMAFAPYYGNGVSDSLFASGLCLPSGSSLTDSDVQTVIDAIKSLCPQS